MDAKLNVETAKKNHWPKRNRQRAAELAPAYAGGQKANPITLDSIRQRGANGRYRQYCKQRDTSKPGKPGDDKRVQGQEGAACTRCAGDQCTVDNIALPKTWSAIDVTREDTMDHSAEQRTSGMWMLRTITCVLHTWIPSLKIRVQHGQLQ